MNAGRGFCRDCLAQAAPGERRCRACLSPRLVDHPELEQLSIAHVDCDAFYAAVEKRDDPSLRDKPLIVGGGRRGVVATCCYIARAYGVRSAMPMFKALNLCPDAVVVRPDMARYGAVARQVRAHMLELTPLVEPLSIDEAFLDLSGTTLLHRASPALALARFARRVESEIGISVSIGLSYCKFLAKIASDLDKPRGFKAVGRAEARDFLAQRPVGLIWGVGAVAQERLAREGFRLIGDIQATSQAEFARRMAAGGLGGEGLRLWRLANGLDDRPVSPDRETKSVSAETTFEEDVRDLDHLARTLLALSEKVSARLKAQDIGGATVTLKLKTADFRLRTRARTLPEPTRLARRIFEAARGLLEKEAQGAAFRLIGVGVSALADARDCDLGDLADANVGREKAAEGAIDALRARFGSGAIVRGLLFDPAGRRNPR